MSAKLNVGSLAWRTRNDDLNSVYEAFGVVEDATVLLDRTTNRSRGFGFVTFSDDTSAEAAEKSMNGEDFDGRRKKVIKAEDHSRRINTRRDNFVVQTIVI